MASGWSGVTSGGWRESPRGRMAAAWLAIAGFGMLHVAVNAASVREEFERAGRRIGAWEPWVWEASSTAVWLAILPAILLAARRLQPPRTGIPAAVGAHLLLTVPVSLVHVGLMNAIRVAVYSGLGGRYAPNQPVLDILLYEYRKDVVTYLLLVGFFLLFDRVVRPGRTAEDRPAPHRIEVRDGARTRWLEPAEIDWAQAAGNYVELHGAFGSLLHRRTLAALEEELAPHGFVRIHRSRLVRRDAVRAVETGPSGDFELAMADGARIGGSRRFRDRL